jgi:site-specific DNA-methyltransferase (adenine-specific)
MVKWTLHILDIASLEEHKSNPREINKDKLKRLESLITEFGLIDKPIVNQDMKIIGGHQRIKILKKKKIKKVECWVPDRLLKQDEINALCVGLNLYQGSWDYDILANEWDPLELLNLGFSEQQLLGLSQDEEEERKKGKKKKTCPSCGHEF